MTAVAPPRLKGMRRVSGGRFIMGSEDFYPEEGPVHPVELDGFWIDEHPVTVAEFRRFVKGTGYLTCAEQQPDPADYPGGDPELLVPGSLTFRRRSGPVDLRDFRNWWEWTPGAFWRRPEGPGSNVGGRELHPVVHVAPADAEATPPGRASSYRARLSVSTQHVAGWRGRCSRGGTSSLPGAA